MRETTNRIWGLVTKELLQLSRDKLLIGFLILGPLLELALMGGLTGGGVVTSHWPWSTWIAAGPAAN